MDKMWEDYCKSIGLLPPLHGLAVSKPADSDLDAFEIRSRFRLPLSYREFVKLLGPGQLASDFSVRTPGSVQNVANCTSNPAYLLVDIDCFNLDLRGDGPLRSEVIGDYSDPDKRIGRLIFFADNTAGDLVGWDSLELVEPATLESAIYIVLGEEMSIRPLVNTFFDFIDKVCYDSEPGDATTFERLESHSRVFRPASIPCFKGR